LFHLISSTPTSRVLIQTEIEVGKALNSSSCPVPRSEVFLTTKHWRAYHGYDEATKCLDLSLKRLAVDYVDLYLIHWYDKSD
jgi:diketogulonate reductase-like aldo/keto reductase